MQLHFAEAEPVIGVKLAGALEAVAEQIQNYNPPALSQIRYALAMARSG